MRRRITALVALTPLIVMVGCSGSPTSSTEASGEMPVGSLGPSSSVVETTIATTTLPPSCLANSSARMRAMMSVVPPGPKGTTIEIGRSGNFDWAEATVANAASRAAPVARSRWVISIPPVCCR